MAAGRGSRGLGWLIALELSPKLIAKAQKRGRYLVTTRPYRWLGRLFRPFFFSLLLHSQLLRFWQSSVQNFTLYAYFWNAWWWCVCGSSRSTATDRDPTRRSHTTSSTSAWMVPISIPLTWSISICETAGTKHVRSMSRMMYRKSENDWDKHTQVHPAVLYTVPSNVAACSFAKDWLHPSDDHLFLFFIYSLSFLDPEGVNFYLSLHSSSSL